jgi:hypothetical protein
MVAQPVRTKSGAGNSKRSIGATTSYASAARQRSALTRQLIAVVLCALVLCGGTRAAAQPAPDGTETDIPRAEAFGRTVTIAQAPVPLTSQPPSASEMGLESRIGPLTHDLVKMEVDLERFYLNYKLVGNKDPRWRRARYFLLQQGATGAAMAATGIPIIETGKNLKHPTDVRPAVFRATNRIGVVAASVGGGSDVIELSSNVLTAVKNKLQHKDPGSVKKELIHRTKTIDTLAAERAALVAQLEDASIKEICECEGKLLKLFRDWCIYEFADVYADVKAYQSSNNVYYAMDLTANSLVGAVYLLSQSALTKPQVGKTAAVTGIVSDSFYIGSAPVSAVAYKLLYNRAYKNFGKEMKQKLYDPESEAKVEMVRLEKLLANAPVERIGPFGSHARLELLELWSARYDEYVRKNEEELRHLAKVSQQNVIQGPVISSSYLATDVMGAIAAFRLEGHPRGVDSLAFAGSISSTAGSAAFFMLSNQWLISENRFEKKLRKEGKLPEQLIAQRLSQLDDLDKRLAKSHPGK